MDELDKTILDYLQSQGFQKNGVIASFLDIGERTVYRRIKAMRHKGIIKIIAIPDFLLIGYKAWAKIGIKVAPQSLSYVTDQLVKNPSIYFVAQSYGIFDIIIAVHFYSLNSLAYFTNSELISINGIINTETMMLTTPRKYYNFLWQRPAFQRKDNGLNYYFDTTDDLNHHELDELDRKILNLLMKDGLARPESMEAILGRAKSTIQKHIKKMSSNKIFKIIVVPNPDVLTYEAWATMGITVKNRNAYEVLEDIIAHSEVYLASIAIGRFNLIIATRFHHIDFINHFVNVELSSINGVSHIETFVHNKPIKYHNIYWRRVKTGVR